jgi:membrane protein
VKFVKASISLLKESWVGYSQANGSLLAAALSFYTVLSLAPLLVSSISITGIIFSRAVVSDRLLTEIERVVGPQAVEAIAPLLENGDFVSDLGRATSFSFLLMLVGASLMFYHLKRAINFLWGIAPQPGQGLFMMIRGHFFSFLMVLAIILLMLVFMFVSTALVPLNWRLDFLPAVIKDALPPADFGLTFVGFSVFFTMIYKMLPDAETSWRDVLLGAMVTSFLFTIGEFLIGMFLGSVKLFGASGAASSVILLLIWVYYSMQIILFGAKFTQIYANCYGSYIRPSKKAALVVHSLEIWKDHHPLKERRPVKH